MPGKYSVRAHFERTTLKAIIVTTILQAQNFQHATELTDDLSPLSLRSAFGQFPSGVAALAGYTDDGTPQGMVASSFTVGVSLEPPLVSVAIRNESTTWPDLRQAHRIGVSILGEGQGNIARQLAAPGTDRFAGLDMNTNDAAIFIPESALWLETSIYGEFPAGDHTVVLLEVHHLADFTDVHEPLVFHKSQFRNIRDH